MLRLHWSVSPQVQHLCEYVYANRHEAQAALGLRERRDDAVIKGRLDPRKTLRERRVSGNPNRVVYYEPIKTYLTGPNHVLVWTVQQAYRLAQRFQVVAHAKSSYGARVREVGAAIRAARRVASVAQAISEGSPATRPSVQALAQAAISRRPLYRLAHAAYLHLLAIETGRDAAIQELLRQTLIGPMEGWRAFEFALVLAVGEALSQRGGYALDVVGVGPGSSEPVLRAGPYDIYWQSKTECYVDPVPEPSEVVSRQILTAYGLDGGDDRPDLVIADRRIPAVVSLGEAKYFTGDTDTWRDRLREAVPQLGRYARAYSTAGTINTLLGRSIIGLHHFPEAAIRESVSSEVPLVFGFDDFVAGRLLQWADRVLN